MRKRGRYCPLFHLRIAIIGYNVREGGAIDMLTERVMPVGHVAYIFGVKPKTISNWVDNGKLRARRTTGGHRRVLESSVRELLKKMGPPDVAEADILDVTD